MRERIIEISHQEGLSHVGSCISMAEVLEEIYEKKNPQDVVILDAGHSHLAHLVAEEKYNHKEIKLPLQDIHCNTDDGCEVSTGSLGLGITVALGRAMADRTRDVYCITSDGACAEGTVWEALRIKTELQLNNLKVYVNLNGYGALGAIDTDWLEARLKAFDPTIQVRRTNSDFNGITGVDAHYKKI
jgi:transketolase N-terminal domain/subunit